MGLDPSDRENVFKAFQRKKETTVSPLPRPSKDANDHSQWLFAAVAVTTKHYHHHYYHDSWYCDDAGESRCPQPSAREIGKCH